MNEHEVQLREDDRMSCLVGRLFLIILIIACPVLGLKMLAEVSLLDRTHRRGDGGFADPAMS